MSLKKAINNLKHKILMRYRSSQRKVFVSFGENCLTDGLLTRHGLKSFATPFSHGRCNVENILQAERDNYKNFLSPKHLEYKVILNAKVPILNVYNDLKNGYLDQQENGFELTHHDVIGSQTHYDTIKRRVEKLMKLRGKKDFYIFYFHRTNPKTNLDRLLQDLKELKDLYSVKKRKTRVICYTQTLVENHEDRKLTYDLKNGIDFFMFYTLKYWGGDNQDVFWAIVDDDLVGEMMEKVKKM